MNNRNYKPILFWFGLATVILPGLFSSLSLLMLNKLWLSSDVVARNELNTTVSRWVTEIYASDLLAVQAQALENSRLNRKIGNLESDFSDDQKKQARKIEAIFDDYYLRTVKDLESAILTGEDPQIDALERDIKIKFPSLFGTVAQQHIFLKRRHDWFALVRSAALCRRQSKLLDDRVADERTQVSQMADRPEIRDYLHNLEDVIKNPVPEVSPPTIASEKDISNNPVFLEPLQIMTWLSESVRVRGLVNDLSHQQQAKLEALSRSEQKLHSTLVAAAYGGFCASLGLAIFLVAWFSAHFRTRLAQLVSDARAITQGSGQLTPLPGNDEIAYIQGILISANDSLKAMEQHRRLILNIVAHDVRTPLMAAQMTLGLAGSLLTGQAAQKTGIVQRQLKSTIEFVEKLLSVESPARKVENAPATASNIEYELSPSIFTSGIFKKVFVTVAIPLVLQIGWLCWITDRLHKEETLSMQQHEMAEALQYCDEAIDLGFSAAKKRALFALTGKQSYFDACVNYSRSLDDMVAHMERAVPATSPIHYSVEAAHRFRNAFHMALFGSIDATTLTLSREFRDNTLAQVGFETERLLRQSVLRNNRLQDEYTTFARSVQTMIVTGISFNIALLLVLFLFFMRNVKGRLNLVVRSAASLTNRGVGEVFVGGSDEIGFLGVVLNNERQRLHEALQQRTLLVSQIANDMKAPLSEAKKVIADLQTDKSLESGGEAMNDLRKAAGGIARAVNIIDDLLTVENFEDGQVRLEREPCDMRHLVDDSIEVVKPLAAKKRVIVECLGEPSLVDCDKRRVLQVLVNLLGNAIKFSPPDSQVIVGCEDGHSFVRISVKDQGPGMDAKTAERVFDKFFQAHGEQQESGFGLGLFISKLIVELHEGTISVESEPNKGSKFVFTLPKNKT